MHRSDLQVAPPQSEMGEHEYPPAPAGPDSPDTTQSSRSPIRFSRVFVGRRRQRVHLRDEARQPTEFGATTNSTSLATTSFPSHPQATTKQDTKSKTPPPHIVVPSFRWIAEPQTFTVRVENEFTVTCTVVQPVARYRFSWAWPSFLKFRPRFRFCFPCFKPRVPSAEQEPVTKKPRSSKKAKRKSKGGVAVEQDTCGDAFVLVERIPEENAQASKRKTPTSEEQPRSRTSRRNSGWAGIFSNDILAADAIAGSSSGSSSHDDDSQEQPGFTIDQSSDRLVVPDVNIGVEYSVKEEEEDLEDLGLVFTSVEEFDYSSYDGDSEDSWLDLE